MNPVSVKDETEPTPSFLSPGDGRRIAYHFLKGNAPGVIFMGGFKSDMMGSKALTLEEFCKSRGQQYIRFDYTGHGQSSGAFREGTIGSWRQDALDVVDQLGAKKNIFVGSSMGGWVMLLAALARPEKVCALLGIASAPDFTEHLIWQQMTPEQKKEMAERGEISLPSCYGEEPYPITRTLIEEGRKHLLLGKPLNIHVPVRLVHGMEDEDVPWHTSKALSDTLKSPDVQVQLIKGAGHRLSEPQELAIITRTLTELLNKTE